MLTGMMHKYIVPAVSGFFRSITLSDGPARGNSLQDTLRLLTLWFDYGHLPDVYEALVEGINKIQIDNWLQVHCFSGSICICVYSGDVEAIDRFQFRGWDSY